MFSSEASISEEFIGFKFEKIKKNCLIEIDFDLNSIDETPL